jgi:2-C-methyl-D-erythritol 2,4-cyclodiphosphate synthase
LSDSPSSLGKNITALRVGSGVDVHRFLNKDSSEHCAPRPLVLGGVCIPHENGLEGHSDADVLVHALMDALLGAVALGDIGTHFPPSDNKYKGISSILLLEHVVSLLEIDRWFIINVDCMVITEAPRLRPYIDKIRLKLAESLKIGIEAVSVKAGTNEKLGFIGREEGMMALATVLVGKGGC